MIFSSFSYTIPRPLFTTDLMSDNAGAKGPEPSERVAIGITFGNSNSSIAYTVDDKAEVIANEDGGMFAKRQKKQSLWSYSLYLL